MWMRARTITSGPSIERDALGTAPARPLDRRFPALARVPRAPLGAFPTPVVDARTLATDLWVKRDDLAGEPLGGNKVRALELLLGGVKPGDRVVTVGAMGSTHVLATATYARQLGARAVVYRWPQEVSAAALEVSRRIERVAQTHAIARTVAGAYVRAAIARLRGARWIPAGGSSPLGVLGHVGSALELAEQIARGELPAPRRIVVPLGSGGTVAGLWLGTAIAGLETEIIGVRVVPRVVANRRRVRRLAAGAARLIQRLTSERVPRPRENTLRIVHEEYGGAYGRETASGREASRRFAAWCGLALDATYSAKALAAVLSAHNDGPTLFWLTFDPRVLAHL